MNLMHCRSYPFPRSSGWVDIPPSRITRKCSFIYTITGIGLVGTTWLYWSDSGVTLEPPPLVGKENVIFVNPSIRQAIGNGSKNAPFKTITQALQAAKPSSAIVLSPGIYSKSSGEVFPLKLKAGVSIQGEPRTQGRNIVIQGGGFFLSPTSARQNVTILGANQATLSGVTVTNPNPRGYGLWIESSSPIVSHNTFTRNNQDGISVTGKSTPNIRNNFFYRNGANGITIYGASRFEVRENVFEKTGFGIIVSQKAEPVLIGNRIAQNIDGVVVQASAKPTLRNNVIEDNTRDGVVAIALAQPDLGTIGQPGSNVFRRNGRYDINNSASRQILPAFGNQLASNLIVGRIDFAGKVNTHTTIALRNTNRTTRLNPQIRSSYNRAIPRVETSTTQDIQSASENAIEISIPPVSRRELPPPPQSRDITSNDAIEIPIPVSASQPAARLSSNLQLQPAQMKESDLLPVPNSAIPIGKSPTLQQVSVKPTQQASGTPPKPPTLATAMGFRYRVVVEAASASKQAFVRSLVPGAFRIFLGGRVMMQVGAFSDRTEALEIQQSLTSKGLKVAIEQLN